MIALATAAELNTRDLEEELVRLRAWDADPGRPSTLDGSQITWAAARDGKCQDGDLICTFDGDEVRGWHVARVRSGVAVGRASLTRNQAIALIGRFREAPGASGHVVVLGWLAGGAR